MDEVRTAFTKRLKYKEKSQLSRVRVKIYTFSSFLAGHRCLLVTLVLYAFLYHRQKAYE